MNQQMKLIYSEVSNKRPGRLSYNAFQIWVKQYVYSWKSYSTGREGYKSCNSECTSWGLREGRNPFFFFSFYRLTLKKVEILFLCKSFFSTNFLKQILFFLVQNFFCGHETFFSREKPFLLEEILFYI